VFAGGKAAAWLTQFQANIYKQLTEGDFAMQTTDIGLEVRTFLVDSFLFGRGDTFGNDTPLLGNVIDSTGVIELVVFLQERFAITVEDDEVTTDNLGSMKSVVAFVEKKRSGKA
jgi:acyl carrier protein